MIQPIWPDEKLEDQFIRDAMSCGDPDMECHVKALIARIRELEGLVARMRTRPDLQPHDEPHWPADV